jgi:chemotaxis regulatin CheY-phosphate phosphatase CheZ
VDAVERGAEIQGARAKALAVAHRKGHERKLAEDVQDHLTRIYEACNFQDIAGQRIGKVIETLSAVEDARTPSNGNGAARDAAPGQAAHPGRLLNGRGSTATPAR